MGAHLYFAIQYFSVVHVHLSIGFSVCATRENLFQKNYILSYSDNILNICFPYNNGSNKLIWTLYDNPVR